MLILDTMYVSISETRRRFLSNDEECLVILTGGHQKF